MLKPDETRRMPVQFVIEEGLPVDINVVTISYAFFEFLGGASAIKDR